MNHQHIQAIRQLLAERRLNDSLWHNGTGAGAGVLASRLQDQYRDEEEVFEALLRGGSAALTNQQRAFIKNTMSTTTGSEGGYTAPTTVAVSVADALKQYSSVRRVGTVMVTAAGQNITYPSSDGRDEVGEQLDQNAASSLADITFGAAALNTFKYGSKVITVPMELVQDSSIDLVGFLERRIAARIGRITNAKFTTGAGTTEPLGIATAATAGKVGASGQTSTVTHDDLVSLIGSVDPEYRDSLQSGWMMRDTTLTAIAELKDSNGRPLKLVKYGSRAAGTPTTLLGYPVETNPDMPAMSAGAKSILFGDFSSYVVRDVADVRIFRMEDSAFTTKGQIGFLGVARAGGSYVDIGGAIKAYQNAAS